MMGTDAPLSVAVAPGGLTLRWSDGESTASAQTLRAICPCAPCRSERPRSQFGVARNASTLVEALPIGHDAIQRRFSDGHERGIYPSRDLRELVDAVASSSGVVVYAGSFSNAMFDSTFRAEKSSQ
jgi:DUF971 family protein